MPLRLLFLLTSWLLIACLLGPAPARAEGVSIARAELERTDEGYKIALSVALELTRALEDAVTRGVPLYFTTEVEISRPRWYWFDKKVASTSQTVRISYNVLTHQYHAAINGRLHQSFNSLEEALFLVRRPNRWLIAEKDALDAGETYTLAVRAGLDIARLPKPFQVHALNSSDWNFSSDWKQFSFEAQ
jgi:hypothetical protein